ncbi:MULTISPECIES: HNH endonuclease [Micrococcaceae]|jgi:5-methylcytosine-specific restriction endonuclease McrA|uniref:5-methylcytosine-specific restriction endonuclease McrA n=3 Tax=Micrococcaceae TaxID=1268 RepID=A0AAJ1STF6_9MICC|nr:MULTISPECIES: HNH endonuclease [Micrococcaceae]HKU03083.1 HNH endonuclease [Arthrobacter sp.]KRE90639.1 HNH endonuclease [Arthrobacter sp. Soil764]MDE8588674.1 HNH endonuclease [Arthrobacter sp. NQ4]MDQ0120119.1 5-methylcytosine-specific restriction endonuclease McrA [Pseudarthrobacter defluvii]MDQ0146891.1 5-methylcytosine-specific restriction endonuclease McrA [Pseudarthrobacter niigatensis]
MRTLVLNAGYEPLAVITFRRALVLVLTGKASVVAEGDDPVVGPTDVLGRPSVILLNRYIRPRYNHSTAVSRRGVLRRDGHKCAYCGKAAHTIDHVHPKSRGGADSWENLVAACLRCNNVKGDHTPAEMGWTLRFVPEPPHGTIWQIKELEKPTPAWDPFLLPERAA